MTPAEFFEKANAGSLVRYDKNFCMSVRITTISRVDKCATGRDTKMHRSVFLYLNNGMLKEGISGSFANVELSP